MFNCLKKLFNDIIITYELQEAIILYKQFCNICSLYDYTNKICLKNHKVKRIHIYLKNPNGKDFEVSVMVRKIGGCEDFIPNINNL